MSLSSEAAKVFDHLPADGNKIGGITLQRELDLSKVQYQKARDELKAEGLVISGAGRGGSLGRVEGVEPEVEKKTTPEERMAHAREAKQAKSRAKREVDDLIGKIVQYCHAEGYPQVEVRDVTFYEIDKPIIMVWDAGRKNGRAHTIPQLDYDKLRATHAQLR